MLRLNARLGALCCLSALAGSCAAPPPPPATGLPSISAVSAVPATATAGRTPGAEAVAPAMTAASTATAAATATGTPDATATGTPDAAAAARAASATALAAARPPDRRPPLGTFFFYWYNCPILECDASRLAAVPDGWTSPLDADADDRDGRWYSSYNYDWYELELRTIASTGISIVLPVSWGEHPHPWFRPDRIDLLVQANSVLEQPLQIGLFLDTTAQQGLYQLWLGRDYRYGDGIDQLPLSDPLSGYFFYERHIRDFFRRVPREMWATVNGRPLIVTYSAGCCRDLQLSGELWSAVKRAFLADFGVEPWLILEKSWLSADAQAGTAQRAELAADGVYRWGSALYGMQSDDLRGYRVSSVGPGFDNRAVADPAVARVQPRDSAADGTRGEAAFLRASLAAVPADSDLVLIETWNEWPEQSAVAPAFYRTADGRPLPQDLYLEVIRTWQRRP